MYTFEKFFLYQETFSCYLESFCDTLFDFVYV